MEHTDLINKYPVCEDSQIDLIIAVGEEQSGRSKSVEYDDFIISCFPSSQSIGIPIETVIKVKLGPHKSGTKVTIFTPGLADCNNLPGCYLGDMVKALGGLKDAQRRGFASWTSETFPQRIYLLELETKFDGFGFADYRELERIRYSVRGELNMGYDRGDYHSWQRYTKKPPVACDILISDATIEDMKISEQQQQEDDDDLSPEIVEAIQLQQSCFLPFPVNSIVTLRPYHALSYNTYYAILLQNNVPVVPFAGPDADFTHFNSSSTTEDKLILFKTVSD
jgi:hypothetical protein